MKKILFDKHKNVIFQRLKVCRIEKNMSQSDLAAKLQTMNVNIDQQMISKIENDNRIVTDYEFACICIALGVTERELLKDFYREYTD